MALDPITAGFLPLTDSAILVAARECGFTEDEGLALHLIRESSWANIRDRMAVGHFDAAHMLAPMPVACNLGLTPLALPLIAPMTLGLGGNAVTVDVSLWQQMEAAGAGQATDPRSVGKALRTVISERAARGLKRLQLAVVHPHSGHNFELRYWLAASGIDPQRDVDIVIVPPPLMPDALLSKRIDGFCVGEPWNTVAVVRGQGRIATVKAAIWKSSPEKVLGVRAEWADANAGRLDRLLRALYRAAEWCGLPENRIKLARILSRSDYIGQSERLIAPALSGAIAVDQQSVVPIDDFFLPFARAATFPWQSHALWFYSQMVRWGQVEFDPAQVGIAQSSYRPDLYRSALAPLDVAMPVGNSKVEGATARSRFHASAEAAIGGPDGFFDGAVFDPDRIEDYLNRNAALHKK